MRKASVLLAGFGAALAAWNSAAAAAPAAAAPGRSFEIRYQATVDVPPGAHEISIWLPYPTSDAHQRVSAVEVTAPAKFAVTRDPELGNSILHLEVADPTARRLEIAMSFRVERDEYRRQDLPREQPRAAPAVAGGGAAPAAPEPASPVPPPLPADAVRWLRPERRVPLDDTIRRLAQEVTAGRPTDLDKARAIYDYVVATMSYDKSGTGWGNGDIYWACDAKRGNCTDFHALFIGLSRAVGIPAKFEIGLPLPPERGAGEIGGYHCWAEFYLRGYGWVPVDASEAKKHPEKRDYFFGAHDENRVQLAVGRDLVLNPRQAGEPLNYFVYPYVEVDGKPLSQVAKSFRYRDLPPAEQAASRRE